MSTQEELKMLQEYGQEKLNAKIKEYQAVLEKKVDELERQAENIKKKLIRDKMGRAVYSDERLIVNHKIKIAEAEYRKKVSIGFSGDTDIVQENHHTFPNRDAGWREERKDGIRKGMIGSFNHPKYLFDNNRVFYQKYCSECVNSSFYQIHDKVIGRWACTFPEEEEMYCKNNDCRYFHKKQEEFIKEDEMML